MVARHDTRTHLDISADVTVETTAVADPALSPSSATDKALAVSGTISQARTGIGLPDVQVVALAGLGSERMQEVGRTKSNVTGRFSIQFGDSPSTRERLLASQHLPESRLVLRAETAEGRKLVTSEPIATDRGAVQVDLMVNASVKPVAPRTWNVLGEFLQSARISHLNEVVRLLSGTTEIGANGAQTPSVAMLERQDMLDEFEQAFLDPTGVLRRAVGSLPSLRELHNPEQATVYLTRLSPGEQDPELQSAAMDMLGKAASFANLDEVDWVIDPTLIGHGDIGSALNKFSDQYRYGQLGPIDLSDLASSTLYRDYLLAIWTTYAAKIVYFSPNQLTPAQALQQLTTRFHQDFTTQDDALIPANAVLIPVVTAILTAPAGTGFGFGIAPAAIDAQGTRTPRDYLNYLIGLTHQSADELGLRYRLNMTRTDSVSSNPVQENIATLQGFFRDSFQCELDPAHVNPDIHNQPIISDKWQGNAPFFLYYDEWVRQQQPFYAENYLDVRQMLSIDIDRQTRVQLANLAGGKIVGQAAHVPQWKFCQDVLAVWDTLQAGHAHFYAGEYALAAVDYRVAHRLALGAMQDNVLQRLPIGALVNQRKSYPLKSMKDLPHFTNPSELAAGGFGYADDPARWALDRMGLRLAYYALTTIPVCLGDAEFATGDYEHAVFHYGQATRFQVGIARESDNAGYRPWYLDDFQMYWRGDKPYTVRTNGPAAADYSRYPLEEDDDNYDSFYDTTLNNPIEQYATAWAQRLPHLAEQRYCRLRQANAMLDWADALYRVNEPTSMARARELYKGVLWLYGRTPPIAPDWPRPGPLPMPTFAHHTENPALISQTARASRGVYQIDHGLNYYGEHEDVVPILRYRSLKDTADRTAAMARGAQQDFLQYTQQAEAATTTQLQLSNFLQKSKLQASIADEQKLIAQHDVVVAQDQATAVQAAIKAKQDEIAQHDSLFGQIGDAISGITSMAKGIPDDTKSAVGAGAVSEATGDEMVGEGMLGAGAGVSVMTGIGIFAVVGYVTLSGMADADNKRSADLQTLGKGLSAAQAMVEARQHSVAITGLQKQIAQADVDLAQSLLAFEQNRTLNQNFWLQLSQIARRLLRRYLEIGARQAWLAERALAYEADRALSVIRMDYFPAQLQGVTGADLMQADLAELETIRIEGMKARAPVRRTVSLAREFPMQYGQLKSTGRCAFRTEESYLRQAHPGTSGYRIRAVSATVQQQAFDQPLRGSLINRGVSISNPQLAEEHVLVRPSESLPLSEFRLGQDMAIYGLPNETLLTFEGSNVETFWELSFPKVANATGLDGLVDVLLTLDMFCAFSPERYEADLTAPPTPQGQWLLISAAKYDPAALAALAGAATTADVVFDLRRPGLFPRQQQARTIKNLAIQVVGSKVIDFTATLSSTTPATSVPVPFKNGFAISGLLPDPTLPPLPAVPLNKFAGLDPTQPFSLKISKTDNPGVDFSTVTEIVLAIEYEANIV